MTVQIAASGSEATTPGLRSQTVIREMTCNVLLALIYLNFVGWYFADLQQSFRLSTLLVLIKVSTDVVFFLTRRITSDVSTSCYDWFVGVAGTYAVAFFRPAETSQYWVGPLLQCVGLGLQVMAMLSLNRSIGIVAANRGIKTNGLYRFVRHPLYLSYAIAFGGYLVSQYSIYNTCIYLAALSLWILRVFTEERFLAKDAEYRAFARRVRYRMVPFVF